MGKDKAKMLITLLLFTSVSLLLCIATFALLAGSRSVVSSIIRSFTISFPLGIIVTVIDYKLITWLRNKNQLPRWTSVITDLAVTLSLGCLLALIARMLTGYDNQDKTKVMLAFVVWHSIVILGIELLIYNKRLNEKETQLAVIEKEKARYQFEALKNQINPHFLFNSLNALASLAYQDAEKTNLFVKKLSQVYRYLLATYERQTVTLSEELDFINAYIYLEKIRFGNAFTVNISIPDESLKKNIVPLSLQIPVENALKHNICTNDRPLTISVFATECSITVTNNLQPRTSVSINNVGLNNLQRQYAMHGEKIRIVKTSNEFKVIVPMV